MGGRGERGPSGVRSDTEPIPLLVLLLLLLLLLLLAGGA